MKHMKCEGTGSGVYDDVEVSALWFLFLSMLSIMRFGLVWFGFLLFELLA